MGHGRIAVIEAMRGIAAVAVALFHYSVLVEGPLHEAFAYGWLGVDVFFVISGFVIPLSLNGRGYTIQQFPQFMARRLVRLEPPYLVSIILVLAMWHLLANLPGAIPPDYSWLQIASHLFYAIPFTSYPWISTVYWSLAYEFVFYIVTGLTFAALIQRPVEWTVLLAAAAGLALYWKGGDIDVGVIEFLVGILTMRIATRRGPAPRLWFWLATSLSVAFYARGPWVGSAVALAAMSILAWRHVELGRWAIVAGSLSYSLYLTHTSIGMPIVELGRRFATGVPQQVALLAIALAASVGFALLFGRLIERPSIRAARNISLRPKIA